MASTVSTLIFLVIQALNQTGFCWRQFRFVSDKEIVARAYRAYLLDSKLSAVNIDRLVAETAINNPECCKVENFTSTATFGALVQAIG